MQSCCYSLLRAARSITGPPSRRSLREVGRVFLRKLLPCRYGMHSDGGYLLQLHGLMGAIQLVEPDASIAHVIDPGRRRATCWNRKGASRSRIQTGSEGISQAVKEFVADPSVGEAGFDRLLGWLCQQIAVVAEEQRCRMRPREITQPVKEYTDPKGVFQQARDHCTTRALLAGTKPANMP